MATLTIQATTSISDCTLISNSATSNFNSLNRVGERNDAVGEVNRLLIKFDLSGIPAGSVIDSATLSLMVETDVSSNARTFRVFRVKRVWVPAQATWNIYSTGNNWGTAGCSNTTSDREATDIGNTSFSASETVGQFKDFTLTASVVQDMVAGTNNGFLVQADTETDDGYGFFTSENGTESKNPKLVVTYHAGGGGAAFFQFM